MKRDKILNKNLENQKRLIRIIKDGTEISRNFSNYKIQFHQTETSVQPKQISRSLSSIPPLVAIQNNKRESKITFTAPPNLN